MSLLRDHGHAAPETYPLGMVADEAGLVVERVNGLLITEANLIANIVSGIGAKKKNKAYEDSVKRLNVKSVARRPDLPDA